MYYIYKITNKTNKKVYIGKTGRNLDVRWREHCSRASQGVNTYFYNAIRKYGENNFIIEKLEETEDSEKINELEQKWIILYDATNPKLGYNLTKGGDGNLQYDWEEIYFLWDKGLSIKEITEQLNCDKGTVGKALKYYSNYSLSESLARSNWQKISILQFDENYNFIKEYDSIAQAARENNCSFYTILKCLKNKTYSALGFYWIEKGKDLPPNLELKNKRKTVAIEQLNLNEEVINTFQSAADAARYIQSNGNIKSISSSILQAAKGKRKTAYGYKWREK